MPKPHYLSQRRRMRVIGRDPLTRALDEAVDRGLESAPEVAEAVDRDQVHRIVRREFGRLVRESADEVSSVPKSTLLEELRGKVEERTTDRGTSTPLPWNGLRAVAPASDSSGESDEEELSSDREALYERRIAKLTASLQRAQEALERLADGGRIEPGMASVFRTVQGLSAEDGRFVQKHAVLSQMLEANLSLQRRLRERVPG